MLSASYPTIKMFTGKFYLCGVLLSSKFIFNYFRLRVFTCINERHRFSGHVVLRIFWKNEILILTETLLKVLSYLQIMGQTVDF